MSVNSETDSETEAIPGSGFVEIQELNISQRDVFRALVHFESNYDVKPNGSEVRDAYEELWGKPIQRGQFYPTIDTLVRKGYVEKGQPKGNMNAYEVSEKGQRLQRMYCRAVCDDLESECHLDNKRLRGMVSQTDR